VHAFIATIFVVSCFDYDNDDDEIVAYFMSICFARTESRGESSEGARETIEIRGRSVAFASNVETRYIAFMGCHVSCGYVLL